MGTCFSSSSANPRQAAANVISATGDLHRFETPVTISEVLLRLSQISSSSSSLSENFICNSDLLSYNSIIPAMSPDEELNAEQLYFVFPNSMLNRLLSASDMAGLAVKASLALNKNSKSSPKFKIKLPPIWSQVKNKISPYVEPEQNNACNDYYYNYTTVKTGNLGLSTKEPVAGGLARLGSLKKLQRYSSKRAKMAVRSFRLTLNTIHEGSVAQ